MARALWKGSISFGLVNIPIELHTAVRNHRPKFRMLHAKDKSPVKFERICIRDGHPVAWEDLVKGYEYQKGHFVVLTKEDFQAAALNKTRTVDIIDFVKADEIDDRFFETPYYLTPSKGGERAYALLREAIRESGRVGIAKFILRDAQHLAAVEVIENAIVPRFRANDVPGGITRGVDDIISVLTGDAEEWCTADRELTDGRDDGGNVLAPTLDLRGGQSGLVEDDDGRADIVPTQRLERHHSSVTSGGAPEVVRVPA